MKLIPISYNGGTIWVDNSRTHANKGEWVVETHNPTLLTTCEVSGFLDLTKGGYKDKVIVAQSTNLSISNLPYIEIEDREESWIKIDSKAGDILKDIMKKEDSNSVLYTISPKVLRKLIVAGYEVASAKKYTEEDLRKSLGKMYIACTENKDIHIAKETTKVTNQIIQSLQSKVESIEIETTRFYDGFPDDFLQIPTHYEKDGKTFLTIKSIKYDTL